MSEIGWIVVICLALAFLSGLAGKGQKGKPGEKRDPVRIHHPHYVQEDEYECSVCRARFSEDVMVCPACGARFSRLRQDDMEFIEEMELYDGDEDEDD